MKKGHQNMQLLIMSQPRDYPNPSKPSSNHVPSKVEETISDPKWIQTITEEIKALQKNDTLTIVPLLRGKK